MRCATWVEHFPGNLRWTNAMQIVKGMAAYGAVAMEEVDRVGARLAARSTRERPRSRMAGGMDRHGRPRRKARRRRGGQRLCHHRRPQLHACRQLLLFRRALHSADRGEARRLPSGAALLARGLRPPLSADRAGRRAPRRHRARRLFHEGAGRLRPGADGGAVQRHGQLQGDERRLRRPRIRQARHPHARHRRAGAGRVAAAAQDSTVGPTTRSPAPRPTIMSPRGRTSIPPRSP